MFLKPDTSRHGGICCASRRLLTVSLKHHNALCIRGSAVVCRYEMQIVSQLLVLQPFRFTPTDVSISPGMVIQAHFYITYIHFVGRFNTVRTEVYHTARSSLRSIPAAGVHACCFSSCADVGRCVSRTARAVAGATRRHRSGRDGLSGFPNGHCFCFLQLGRARRLQ